MLDASNVSYQLFVGIDIAAATATISWQTAKQKPSKPITLKQTMEDFVLLHQRLMKTGALPGQILGVMEATRIYWLSFAPFLARQGYAVSVINPTLAHHFAKTLLKRTQTDAIDAQTLTQLAAEGQPALWTPPPAIYEELEQRLTQRDSLLLLRGQVCNQLHALQHNPVVVAPVRQRMQALDQTLTAQVAEIEAEMATLLTSAGEDGSPDQDWAKNIARLQTIPGVGLRTAMWIVVTTMNFTLCASAEQAATYAGLAPMPGESGTSVYKRPCWAYRQWTAASVSTLSAARYNPVIKAIIERLQASGKPTKVARCAAAPGHPPAVVPTVRVSLSPADQRSAAC
jgi:transposase